MLPLKIESLVSGIINKSETPERVSFVESGNRKEPDDADQEYVIKSFTRILDSSSSFAMQCKRTTPPLLTGFGSEVISLMTGS